MGPFRLYYNVIFVYNQTSKKYTMYALKKENVYLAFTWQHTYLIREILKTSRRYSIFIE